MVGRRARTRFGLALLAAVMVDDAWGRSETYVRIDTRPGVSLAFMLIEPVKPEAAVLLFAGGDGRLKLSPPFHSSPAGYGALRNNFLVRSRQLFAQAGMLVAVVDAASDFQGADGLLGERAGRKHAEDIGAVIAYVRRRAAVPVWVVGTSRGTISAANAAAQLGKDAPAGVVLTAVVTQASRHRPQTVYDVRLERIRLPVLLVHHKNDTCAVSPVAGAADLERRLKNAARVELLSFQGGEAARGEACGALSPHGFLGIEREVVGAIAAWIKRAQGPGTSRR